MLLSPFGNNYTILKLRVPNKKWVYKWKNPFSGNMEIIITHMHVYWILYRVSFMESGKKRYE